ncbi:hypothetical protein [Methylorubrum aminovorans]
MDENDPLWYDYAEPDEPPDPWLHALAGVFWVLVSIISIAKHVYRLPDRVWQWNAGWIARRVATGIRRFRSPPELLGATGERFVRWLCFAGGRVTKLLRLLGS